MCLFPLCLPCLSLYSPADLSVHAGLSSYKVDLDAQSADVYTESVPFETVFEKIKKTGKTVKGAEADGEAMTV